MSGHLRRYELLCPDLGLELVHSLNFNFHCAISLFGFLNLCSSRELGVRAQLT